MGDLKIAQSLAIARYLSRVGGLEGKTDADFAVSEMLIQEFEDIYGDMAKANYVPDDAKVAAWTKFRDEIAPKHLGNLEKLLPTGATYFTSEGPTAGDLAAYMALSFVLDVCPDALAAFPKLAAFNTHIQTLPGVQEYLAKDNVPQYFKVCLVMLAPAAVNNTLTLPPNCAGDLLRRVAFDLFSYVTIKNHPQQNKSSPTRRHNVDEINVLSSQGPRPPPRARGQGRRP